MRDSFITYTLHYISTNWVDMLKQTAIAASIFIIIYFIIIRIITKVKKRIEDNSLQSSIEYSKKLSWLIWKVLFIVWMIFNVLIIFEVIWLDVALLMAWLSLWLWFAMETTISNMVAWFFILTNKKIKIWDYVEILWNFNTKWTIEEISLKHTIIRTIDMRRLLIPNMTMTSTPIKTIKIETLVRWDMEISLPRHINISQIKSILNETINKNENILNKSYTNTYIKWFDAKWYKFHSVFFLNPNDWSPFAVWSSLRETISKTLRQYWIAFPYEHIVINIE